MEQAFIKKTLSELQAENIELSFEFKKKLFNAEQNILNKLSFFYTSFLGGALNSIPNAQQKDYLINLLDFLLRTQYCLSNNIPFTVDNVYEVIVSQDITFFNTKLSEEFVETFKKDGVIEFIASEQNRNYEFVDTFSLILLVYMLQCEELTYGKNVQKLISDICSIVEIKNAKYGNAILDPPNYFVKSSSDFLIKVQMNNKLTRILNLHKKNTSDEEDAKLDLLGYYVLLHCI